MPKHTVAKRHATRVRKIQSILSRGRADAKRNPKQAMSLNQRIKQSSEKRA